MIDGMVTHSRAMKEQINSLTECHDALFSHLDAMCFTIQQHSDSYDTLQKSLVSLQTVMANIIVKVSKLDQTTPPPPLLPPPLHKIISQPYSPPSSHLPKLEFPLSTGKNVLSWLFQIEHFFQYHHIPRLNMELCFLGFYYSLATIFWQNSHICCG